MEPYYWSMKPLECHLESVIRQHFFDNNIHIHQNDISDIISRVMNGEYAFQIIYDEVDKFDAHLPAWVSFKLKLIKPLNDSLLYREMDYWSYRRTTELTNAYSTSEILLFDRNEIREIKLKSELNI